MNKWSYFNPVKIQYSDDYTHSIAEYLRTFDKTPNTVLFCYNWFEKTGQFGRLISKINKPLVYSDIEENPSLSSCQRAINAIKSIDIDLIIAIGGGSVIDTAKVVRASIYKDIFDVNELFEKVPVIKNIPEFIAIPTTHGTGSEVTMWATVWDKENKEKKSLSEIENYPTIALYDVSLVKDLPVNISIITTLDALSHAFESIWNKNRNPISTQFAIQAIKLIYENINKINGDISKKTQKNLITASMYAGLAFSNTKTAAAHSISYPLTLLYNIPHGIACSLPLQPLMQMNYLEVKDDIDTLLNFIEIKDYNLFWERIWNVSKKYIPYSLHEFNLDKSNLNLIVNESFTKGRIDNNITDLSKKDIHRILEVIF